MKKLFIILCLMILACCHAVALSYRSLAIMNKDGGEYSISYQEGMKITFNDQTLTLTGADTNDGLPVQFSYSFDDVKGFRFSTDEGELHFGGVEEVTGDVPSIVIEGTTLIARNLAANTTASVYSADGRILFSACADSSGLITIDLKDHINQVLIVKAGYLTCKTIIKQ